MIERLEDRRLMYTYVYDGGIVTINMAQGDFLYMEYSSNGAVVIQNNAGSGSTESRNDGAINQMVVNGTGVSDYFALAIPAALIPHISANMGSGSDTFQGRAIEGTILGGNGNDAIYAGGQDVYLGEGDDFYQSVGRPTGAPYNTNQDIHIHGESGDDQIFAQGTPANDTVFAWLDDGNDQFIGHSYIDRVLIGSGVDTVSCGDASDWVYVVDAADDDVLDGGPGDDYLVSDKPLVNHINFEFWDDGDGIESLPGHGGD